MFSGQGRIDALNVNYHGDTLYVQIEGIAPRPKQDMSHEEMEQKLRTSVDLFQDELEQRLKEPVIVEIDVIPVELISVSSGGEELDPVGFEEPHELDEEGLRSNPEN